MVLQNTDTGIQKQGHTVEGMWTRILFQLVSSWNPVPCQSNMNWLIWLPNPDCVIRSDAHDFMSIWGFRFFFWSILLISSNFHILSQMMMILSSLFFACLWLPCKGVVTNLNDALFRKLTQQFQEHVVHNVAFNLLPRKTNSSPFTPQKWCLEDKLYTFLLNWSAVFKGELLIFGVEWVL